MIRLFGGFSAFLAICPIGLYCAGPAAASPPGESQQCSFVVDGPKVVNLSGMNYVTASMHTGACTQHASTNSTVCLSIEGGDSAGECQTASDPNSAIAYYAYRPGATYVLKGLGCSDIMQGSDSPGKPTTVCQDIAPSRVTL
jgi:hypothetical protein